VTRTSNSPRDAAEALKNAYRALVTGHRNPDGDAIGSELALAELARRLGVEATIINRDPTPGNLKMLPGVDTIQVLDALPSEFPEAYDLVVTIECPELERAGFDGLGRLPILNIDHHPGNPAYGVVNYLDAESPAVGEMVLRLYGELNLVPTPEAATNLLTALSTDTGDFRYSNATSRAFRAAAEMVDAGARPATIANWIHNHRSLASVRLLGESLQTLRIEAGGKLALIAADAEAYARAGAGPEDSEEIVNVPRSIAGVEAVAYFKQWQPGMVKVSLRSRGSIDVRAVAGMFGGGGHTNAAGCTFNGELETAIEMISSAMVSALGDAP
jgi:phosphoesterase RecJ-like protein